MAKQAKTNDQMIAAMLKEIQKSSIIGTAVLRERLVKISQVTRESIKKNPEAWRNPIISANEYLKICDIIDKHLNAEDLL